MSDEKKRHDFGDFFPDSSPSEAEPEEETREHNRKQIPYYYSYGPYRYGEKQAPDRTLPAFAESIGGHEDGSGESRELTQSDSSREYGSRHDAIPPKKEWSYPVRKTRRFRFKSGLASFLAGALMVSGLMFAADRTNLFTGDAAHGIGENNSAVTEDAANDGSGSSGRGADGVTQVALNSPVTPNNIPDMVEMAKPAVVKIETYVSQSVQTFYSPFDFFFGVPRTQPETDELVPGGQGSGFFFDSEGYILTNQHVIEDAKEIYVQVEGYAEPFKAELLGSDQDLDLAVLKIEGEDPFPTLSLGNSDTLEVGDWVVAIGNPYGFDHTVTVGVLSAKEREIPIPDPKTGKTTVYKHLLQTDASINPGNSGGPLLNLKGEVIGINTAVSTEAQGIGFAIPTSVISGVLDNLKNDIPIPKPYIGVYLSDLSPAGLKELGIENGVVIASVIDGSPAAAAKLQPFDVIVEIDGTKITSVEQLQELVSGMEVGQRIKLRILRDGNMITAGLTVGDQNAEQ